MRTIKLLLTSLSLLMAGHLYAASDASKDYGVSLVTNIFARPSINLCGQWNYIVDPLENGYYDYRRKSFIPFLKILDLDLPMDFLFFESKKCSPNHSCVVSCVMEEVIVCDYVFVCLG